MTKTQYTVALDNNPEKPSQDNAPLQLGLPDRLPDGTHFLNNLVLQNNPYPQCMLGIVLKSVIERYLRKFEETMPDCLTDKSVKLVVGQQFDWPKYAEGQLRLPSYGNYTQVTLTTDVIVENEMVIGFNILLHLGWKDGDTKHGMKVVFPVTMPDPKVNPHILTAKVRHQFKTHSTTRMRHLSDPAEKMFLGAMNEVIRLGGDPEKLWKQYIQMRSLKNLISDFDGNDEVPSPALNNTIDNSILG